MKSFFVKITPAAALTASLLFSAEPSVSRIPARSDLTLLPGPNLFSAATRPIDSPSISSELVSPARPIAPTEMSEARKKLAATQERLEERLRQLRAERAAALARKKELNAAATGVPPQPAPAPRVDLVRFEMQLLPTPVELPRSTPPA